MGRLTEILHCVSVQQDQIHNDRLSRLDLSDKKVCDELIQLRADIKKVEDTNAQGMFF